MKMDFSKMQITFKFRLEELENMIEVYARQPMKGELEEGVRRDIRNIRLNIEEIINTEKVFLIIKIYLLFIIFTEYHNSYSCVVLRALLNIYILSRRSVCSRRFR